jgi:hypothetical protein
MNPQRGIMMALGILLSLGMAACATDTTSSEEKSSSTGLRAETSQEQQEKQQQLERQNREERQRLEASSMREPGQIPPYTENQPIGGQKQAGPADFPQPAFPFVKGELAQIEGEFYTLKDAEGKDVRVHVDKSTKMDGIFRVGDVVEVQRTLPGHAVWMKKSDSPLAKSPTPSPSAGLKDTQVTLGGAKQAVRGELLRIEGENYVIKDGHGNQVRLAVNQNTRMFCGSEKGGLSNLLPAPSASDQPGAKAPQDLALTAEQQGSQVGPGTKPAAKEGEGKSCFQKGELIEAEISDMGVATFIKQAGRPQPGQPLP